MNDLTMDQKMTLAVKYAQLNELLVQRKKIMDEIHGLMDRANQLKTRADELDDQFHRLAIQVEPTEIINIRKDKKPDSMKMVSSILAKLEEAPPDLVAQLTQILKGGD